MTEWLLDLFVPGIPAPQGSKNGFAIAKGRGPNRVYTGQVAMAESSKKVKPWRKLVNDAAHEAWDNRPALDEPLVADYEFVFARLKSFRDHKPTPLHTVYPDTSKLVRSTEDALTTAGVWKDDARCVTFTAHKRRAEPGETPGARIRVARWTPAPALAAIPLLAYPGGSTQAEMYRGSADRLEAGYPVGGSGMTAAVVQLMRNAADALTRPAEATSDPSDPKRPITVGQTKPNEPIAAARSAADSQTTTQRVTTPAKPAETLTEPTSGPTTDVRSAPERAGAR